MSVKCLFSITTPEEEEEWIQRGEVLGLNNSPASASVMYPTATLSYRRNLKSKTPFACSSSYLSFKP